MAFRRITRLEINGLVIEDCCKLTRFVQALDRIDSKPHYDEVPGSEEDFGLIKREVVYQFPNILNVKELDPKYPNPGRLTYFVEF
jgi:hypothetical protein